MGRNFYFAIVFLIGFLGKSFSKTLQIASSVIVVDASTFQGGILPGDTLLFEPGERSHVILRNLAGTHSAPIFIANTPNQLTTIKSAINYGLSVQNCTHFILSGELFDNGQGKGLVFEVPNGVAIGLTAGSSNYTLEYLMFTATEGPAILAKTDPDCSFQFVRENFEQGKVIVRNCLFNESGTEAIYIGSTFFNGQLISCDGKDTLLMPHMIDTVLIYQNEIVNPGWDGIQVSSTKFMQVFENTVVNASQKQQPWQMNAIIAGGGSAGVVYNNWVINPLGTGIGNFTSGPVYFFNNVIYVESPQSNLADAKYGMYIDGSRNANDSGYISIFNNLIFGPKEVGVFFKNAAKFTTDSMVNNIVVLRNASEQKAFDLRQAVGYFKSNNLVFDNLSCFTDSFVDNLSTELGKWTIIVNQGMSLPSIENYSDIFGNERLVSGAIDLGPMEVQQWLSTGENRPDGEIVIFPNPATDYLRFFVPMSTKTCNEALATVSLYNLDGACILQRKQNFEPGAIYSWDFEKAISPGVYIFVVSTETYQLSAKVLVVKN